MRSAAAQSAPGEPGSDGTMQPATAEKVAAVPGVKNWKGSDNGAPSQATSLRARYLDVVTIGVIVWLDELVG